MRDITTINAAIKEYFQQNNIEKCKPKDLMPLFIRKQIFSKDNRQGQPFRKVLRALDDKNLLYQIPSVIVERKLKNRYWWIVNLKKSKKKLLPTSRQPSNAGGFRGLAFTKPANDRGRKK